MRFKRGDKVKLKAKYRYTHVAVLSGIPLRALHQLFDKNKTQTIYSVGSAQRARLGDEMGWTIQCEFLKLADKPREEDKPAWAERWARLME